MTDTLATQPIVNGATQTVNQLVAQVTIGGVTSFVPVMEILNNGSLNSSGNPVFEKPGSFTLVPLDISTIVNAGTAAAVLNAGNATAGGFIVTQNPAGMIVNQIGTAGTVIGGSNIEVNAGQVYAIAPSAGAVSVISTGTSVVVSGYGYQ